MKFLNNILLGIILIIGIGLMTVGSKLGSFAIVISIFYGLFLLYKRKLIRD